MGEKSFTHPSLTDAPSQLSPAIKREKDPFNPSSCPITKKANQGNIWDLMVT